MKRRRGLRRDRLDHGLVDLDDIIGDFAAGCCLPDDDTLRQAGAIERTAAQKRRKQPGKEDGNFHRQCCFAPPIASVAPTMRTTLL